MNRDDIDFGSGDVRKTFLKMLWPTLLGMVSMVVLNLTDGAFVGHGAGSDALAAINIVAPIYLICGGISLMFGMGASVVASVHMSKGKHKAANINVTQAIIGAEIFTIMLDVFLLIFPQEACRFFGSSEKLMELATTYMFWIALLQPFGTLSSVGMFLIRLDGNPKLAMWITTGAAICNMFFDWLLIFPFHMGIEGAAIATGGTFAAGGIITLFYLLGFTRTLKLYRIKLSRKSMLLSFRNIMYQMRLGSSAFFGDVAIAFVMIIGNYVFMHHIGEDGVAAFSLACYCFPVVFNIGNAIVVSAQPLISFAHGVNNDVRMKQAIRLAFKSAVVVGLCGFLVMSAGASLISALFLSTDCHAYDVSVQGLPLFGTGFVFIALNLIIVGCLQSTERASRATIITILRGYALLAICFTTMPMCFGVQGVWLSMPVAEAITFIIAMFLTFVFDRRLLDTKQSR